MNYLKLSNWLEGSRNDDKAKQRIVTSFAAPTLKWIARYFPHSKSAADTQIDLFDHIFKTSPLFSTETKDPFEWIKLTSIQYLLKLRGRNSYFRQVKSLPQYRRKHTQINPNQLAQLPDLEQLLIQLHEQDQFELPAVAAMLGISIPQINWLFYNTDAILEAEKDPAYAEINPAAAFAFLNFSKKDVWRRFQEAKGHAKPTQGLLSGWTIAASVVITITVIFTLFFQQYQTPKLVQKQGTLARATVRTEKPTAISESHSVTSRPTLSQGMGYTPIKQQRKPLLTPLRSKQSNPAQRPIETVTTRHELPMIPIGLASVQSAIEIKGNLKSPIPYPSIGKKRILKLRLSVGMQSPKQGNAVKNCISASLGLVKSVSLKKKIRFGIEYLPIAYQAQTSVSKQYATPSQQGSVAIDSVIRNQTIFMGLPVVLECSITPQLTVHAGVSIKYRLADRGESNTVLRGPGEGITNTTYGTIKSTSNADFATFYRESPYKKWHGGISAGFSYYPKILGKWSIYGETYLGITPYVNPFYNTIGSHSKKLWSVGVGISCEL